MQIKHRYIKSRIRVQLATLFYIVSKLLPLNILPSIKGKTRVLVFHHLDNILRFEKIISSLTKKYNIIDFNDYINGDKNNEKLNIIIAFDDGYLSWYKFGLPVFKKYNIRPILFVSSGYIGLNTIDSKKFCNENIGTWPEASLSWENLKILSENSLEIGGHTLNHVDLTITHDLKEIINTIKVDREKLAYKLKTKIQSFSYPFGRYNNLAVKAAEKAGYTYAFTSDSGYLEDSLNNYLLKRTNIGLRSPISVMAAAEGWLDFVSYLIRSIKRFCGAKKI